MGAYARRYAAAVAAGQLGFAFHFEVERAKTHRGKVLEVLASADGLLTGQEVALRTGLSYKQALNALMVLHEERRISRAGRKFTARWGRVKANTGHDGLESFFRSLVPHT